MVLFTTRMDVTRFCGQPAHTSAPTSPAPFARTRALAAAPGRATRRTGSVRTPWADWSSGTGGENRV